ncbi:MAG TPA: hypothetical protein VEO55_00085 [Candidatus Dormibacteraeota bacterium]|nr:hypothetical protein [Candidatus Dormibacteraeota bacterium]
MAGYLKVWGKSLKDFDSHHRACLPLTERAGKSLAKINANLLEIYNLNEAIAKYAATQSNLTYGVGMENEDPALVPIKTIIQTIDGPRALMSSDDVKFYRSNLKSIIKQENSTLAELDKLARTMRETLGRLRKIERFFQYTDKQEQDARRKAEQGASGARRATKSRRRKK